VLDIERCLLQSESMNALLDEFPATGPRACSLGVRPETERGLLRFVMMREGRRTSEAWSNVVGAAPDVETLAPVADALRARVPATVSVVLNVNAKKASVAVGSEEHLLLGRDHIRETLGAVTFQVSANSFFQTNTQQAERLFSLVADACELDASETLLDLYSGTGAISLLLARRVRAVYGIEVAAAAVADAIPQRARQRHRQLHVPRGRGSPRAARPRAPGGECVDRRGRSAARGLPSKGAARAGGHGARADRVRLVQPVHARARRGRPRPPRLPARVGAAGGHVPADPAHRGRRPACARPA